MKYIDSGVTAAKGFKAGGVHAGIRKNKSKKDFALIVSEVPCTAAAVYTKNFVKGAPLYVTQENLANGKAQAVICNSGNANTCNANGVEIARGMCAIVESMGVCKSCDVIVASTGVIGQPLSLEPMEKAAKMLFTSLSESGSRAACDAIMTTDTVSKEAAVEFEIGGKVVRIGGIAKGSGMIHPNMATMLVFITTDAAISQSMLNTAVKEDVKRTFNMVSVDGDTSTNDMLSVMANGLSGAEEIKAGGEAYTAFCTALNMVTTKLCKLIAGDGEGATKLLECTVTGAKNEETAQKIAKSVITSSLVKAAMFGADANWGRVLCSIGYSGADFDVQSIGVAFKSAAGQIEMCSGGAGVDFDETKAKKILLEKEIQVLVTVGEGNASAKAWGCDLTYDYVKINGDYRT